MKQISHPMEMASIKFRETGLKTNRITGKDCKRKDSNCRRYKKHKKTAKSQKLVKTS